METTSHLLRLPDELLLHVAKHLNENIDDIRFEGQPSTGVTKDSKSLLAFCRVNKRCGRVGQEAMLLYCDLAYYDARKQPLQLAATLVSRPELAQTVYAIKVGHFWDYDFDHRFTDAKLTKKTPLYRKQVQGMAQAVRNLSIRDGVKLRWVKGLKSGKPWAYIGYILLVAKNVRQIYIDSMEANQNWVNLMGHLRQHLQSGPLEHVQHFTIKLEYRRSAVHPIAKNPWLFQIPQLRTLEVIVSQYDEDDVSQDGPFEEDEFTELDQPTIANGLSAIHTLQLSETPTWEIQRLLRNFPSMTSLTYTPGHVGLCGNDSKNLLEALLPFKDCLEHLELFYANGENMLPLHLKDFVALKTLKVRGCFSMCSLRDELEDELEDEFEENAAHDTIRNFEEDFFPQNIEHFVLAGSTQHSFCCQCGEEEEEELALIYEHFEDLLPRVKLCLPNLKSFVLGRYRRQIKILNNGDEYDNALYHDSIALNEQELKAMQGNVVFLVKKNGWWDKGSAKEEAIERIREEGRTVFDYTTWEGTLVERPW